MLSVFKGTLLLSSLLCKESRIVDGRIQEALPSVQPDLCSVVPLSNVSFSPHGPVSSAVGHEALLTFDIAGGSCTFRSIRRAVVPFSRRSAATPDLRLRYHEYRSDFCDLGKLPRRRIADFGIPLVFEWSDQPWHVASGLGLDHGIPLSRPLNWAVVRV